MGLNLKYVTSAPLLEHYDGVATVFIVVLVNGMGESANSAQALNCCQVSGYYLFARMASRDLKNFVEQLKGLFHGSGDVSMGSDCLGALFSSHYIGRNGSQTLMNEGCYPLLLEGHVCAGDDCAKRKNGHLMFVNMRWSRCGFVLYANGDLNLVLFGWAAENGRAGQGWMLK